MSQSRNKAEDIFKTFNKLNVLIIGDVMIDSYLWGNVNRISPEAPVPIVSILKKENRLGGAANVALNIKAMGANPILCSVIGDDENATLLFKLLKQEKINGNGVIKSTSRTTTVKTRVIGNNHQMLRVDEETDNIISLKDSKKFCKLIIENYINKNSIDVIIFEDYDKGVITSDVIKLVVEAANKKKIPTVVDPKKRNFLNYKNVSLFKPNLKELKEGLKVDIENNDIKEIEKITSSFRKKQNIATALITLSERGIYIQNNNSKHLIPAFVRNISDVSGAGDTVVSVAALCLALNLKPQTIATIANLAGGLVCEKIGVIPIDKTQLLNEVKRLNILT